MAYMGGSRIRVTSNHFGLLLLNQLHIGTFIRHCPVMSVAVNTLLSGRTLVSPIKIC